MARAAKCRDLLSGCSGGGVADCHCLSCSSLECGVREAFLTQEDWDRSGFSRPQ